MKIINRVFYIRCVDNLKQEKTIEQTKKFLENDSELIKNLKIKGL